MNRMSIHDEADVFLWIDETLQGQVRSFNTIINKYQDRIYNLVARSIGHREDAKDITQNVFVNAFSNLATFRRECSFGTWLHRIAVNQVKNYWRSSRNRGVIGESELKFLTGKDENRFGETTDANQKYDSEESRRRFTELISFLPLKQRQMFILYYAAEYTCLEIAEIFKTSPSNIKIQLHRGRKLLYRKLVNLNCCNR
jgi:RNA polymerase sigma-70 factor (ECF subfamily)